MKKDVLMLVIGSCLTFIPIVFWILDNSLFNIMGLISISGVVVVYLGLLVYIVEKTCKT